MKFFVTTFGCRTNQADSAAIRSAFLGQKMRETRNRQEADLIVINSCTVTHRTDQQVRQLTRKMRRENPNARIIVTGCYAQREPELLAGIAGVDAVVGNTRKREITSIWRTISERGRSKENPSPIFRDGFNNLQGVHLTPATQIGGKTRPFVKIQDGCDASCAYCVIPEVRGPSRSVPPEQILKHVRDLVEQGFREIVLTGIHLGSYGMHMYPRYPLDRLLAEIVASEGIGQVRLSSIEPMELSRRIVDLAAESDRIAPHFHICLQSGSDRLLRRMRRPYNTARFGDIVQEIRQKIPQAGIGTDVIVGFPGETEEDYEKTWEFIEEMPFTYLHVFPYSDRPGTLASKMEGKVSPDIVRRRAKALRQLSTEKNDRFRRQFLGKSISVLTLTEKTGSSRRGLSGNYLQVKLDPKVPGNRLVEGRVDRLDEDCLILADQELRVVK
jgi:threonylcarbamoyladenosine tRNA methylthiotransferase MtaB